MILAFVSIIAVSLGILLVLGLGFGATYFLWLLFRPPDPPDESG